MNKKAVLAVVLLLSLLITGVSFSVEAKLKAGFIYVGPIGI